MFAQISRLKGMSKESIHTIKTSTGEEVRMRVSAVDDFENYFNGEAGKYHYERPFVYRVSITEEFPECISTLVEHKRFRTAGEAYSWGVTLINTYVDKLNEVTKAIEEK